MVSRETKILSRKVIRTLLLVVVMLWSQDVAISSTENIMHSRATPTLLIKVVTINLLAIPMNSLEAIIKQLEIILPSREIVIPSLAMAIVYWEIKIPCLDN